MKSPNQFLAHRNEIASEKETANGDTPKFKSHSKKFTTYRSNDENQNNQPKMFESDNDDMLGSSIGMSNDVYSFSIKKLFRLCQEV